jgi:hypothetical protein
VEQELPTLPEHLSSPPVYSGVRFTRSLVLYVCFVDHCLSFCTFSFGHCVVCSSSFGHCVVCSSSIYGFLLPLWYLQTLLARAYHTSIMQCYVSITKTQWFLKSKFIYWWHSIWFPRTSYAVFPIWMFTPLKFFYFGLMEHWLQQFYFSSFVHDEVFKF